MTTTSYSKSSMYTACPKAYDFRYKQKWSSETDSPNLYFGTAIDEAVSHSLEGGKDYLAVFNDKWYSTYNPWKKIVIPIYDNQKIEYKPKDLDLELFEEKETNLVTKWLEDLNIKNITVEELVKKVQKSQKNPYKKQDKNSPYYIMYNRLGWLSCKKRGEILLQSFMEQFYPRVEKVLATQKKVYIKDEVTGDAIQGAIDFVVKIKDHDNPIIFDLKTSASLYKQEYLDNSEQLTLYAAIEHENFKTRDIGYVVLLKNIPRVETGVCKICGHIKNSSHQTCNNLVEIEGKSKPIRCGGEWELTKKLDPQVQVMIQSKTDEDFQKALLDQGNIIKAMNNDIIYRNLNKCNSWYGGKCPFFNLCHHNDSTGLIKG